MNDPTSPNEQNAGRASTDNREGFRLLSAEIRLLIITIVGTVAGTLVAVLLVGLAFWFLHIILGSSHGNQRYWNLVIATVLCVAGLGFIAIASGSPRRRTKLFSSHKLNLITMALYWLGIMWIGVLILVWIGVAAGISK